MAKSYSDFPRYRMPQDAMAAFSGNLPNLLLAAYFSPAAVGFYLLATRVLFAPVSLIREAVRNVFYQRATELHQEGGDLYHVVLKATAGFFVLCLPLTLLIFFVGEPLFTWVFGAEWQIAGRYAKYIGILMLASVCNTPSVVVVPILGKNAGLLLYEIFSTGLRVGALVLGGLWLSAENTVKLFCLTSALGNICLIAWICLSLKPLKSS